MVEPSLATGTWLRELERGQRQRRGRGCPWRWRSQGGGDDILHQCRAEVLLKVAAANVNRTDMVQQQGGYAAPPDASPCAHCLTYDGYGEKVVVTDAADLPEVVCIVWSTVFMTSHLSPANPSL
ncbi:hypothetical protein ZWY2020_036695 [Hordeum vulgare]|nr:hypothetical protein ZWY2020_036695 [Hordeum vulgare]